LIKKVNKMKILEFDDIKEWTEPTVLVLGYFDGLHKGHQALFEEAKKVAQILNLKIAVLTFPENPKLTFKKFEMDFLLKLTSDKKRAQLFEEHGVDYLIFKNLTSEFSAMTASEFSEKIIKKLNAHIVITGFDHRLGSDLQALTSTEDYKVIVVDEISDEKGKISSSRIREAIKAGDVHEAHQLLGFPYEMTGRVVHGFARGRQLGYPTANLIVKDYIHIPSPGVYTVDVLFQGKKYRGDASIGYNDTFDGKEKTIEVYIFDFDKDIYGEEITVQWLNKEREMIKFESIEALIEQLKEDERIAREWK